MSTLVLTLITGVGLGALYFLVASGLSLIYGLMHVLNPGARHRLLGVFPPLGARRRSGRRTFRDGDRVDPHQTSV